MWSKRIQRFNGQVGKITNELFFFRVGVWGFFMLSFFKFPMWSWGIFLCICGFIAICIRWKKKPEERKTTQAYGILFCGLAFLFVYYAILTKHILEKA